MTEQDHPFSRDKEAQEDAEAGLAAAGLDAAEQDEDSLVFSAMPDETEEEYIKTAGDVAGGGIGGGEVRSVDSPPAQKASNRPLILLLLFVVVVGAGYFLISGGSGSEPTSQAVVSTAPKKQPIPERQPVTDPVKEEAVEQPPIASVEQPLAAKPQVKAVAQAVPPKVASTPEAAVVKPAPVVLYSVLVGPFISKSTQDSANAELKQLGFDPQLTQGKGVVTMTRLLEGVYPDAEARLRIIEIKKKTGDAFMLPTGDMRSIYVGSFSDAERAANYAEQLAEKGLKVSLVSSDIEMSGKMLLAVQADQKTARQVAELIGRSGLKTQVVRK